MSNNESADDYVGVVVQIGRSWRVIRCRDGVQWILQARGSPKRSRPDDWRGVAYHRSRQALITRTREIVGALDAAAAAVLAALPETIEAESVQ